MKSYYMFFVSFSLNSHKIAVNSFNLKISMTSFQKFIMQSIWCDKGRLSFSEEYENLEQCSLS